MCIGLCTPRFRCILTIWFCAAALLAMAPRASVAQQRSFVDADPLAAGFKNPPMTARPRVYWFWMGQNVSREGITADLEAMRQAGLGGLIHMAIADSVGSWDTFEITGSPTPENRMLGRPWWDLLAFAVGEAGRRGMFLDLYVSPGYATCGGPWITPEESMQLLAFSSTPIDGAAAADKTIVLPRPPAKPLAHPFHDNTSSGPGRFRRVNELYDTKGFYRDVAVVAVPMAGDNAQPDLARGTDISDHMRPDGTLDWRPPDARRWVVYRIGHGSTGRCVHPCPPEGRGLEADKWSARAIETNYRSYAGKLLAMLDADGRRGLRAVHIDSYEAGPQNWTETFRDDFRRRRGYDPAPFLPLLSVDRKAITQERGRRFLYDFDRTATELFAERMIGKTAELARRDGLQVTCEPYGGGLKSVELLSAVDLPLDTFCNAPPDGTFALSATYAGKPLVGAEAFTCFPQHAGAKLDAAPVTFIPRAHAAFARGINMLYFHSWAHDPFPDTVRPGMVMGQWGTQIGRKTTWWKQSRPFFDYLARCQYLLQQGVRVVDELNMRYCPSSGFLNDLTVRDGRLFLPDGSSFRWIRLSDDRAMRPEVARRLRELVAAGAVVAGPKPVDAPGLEGYPTSVHEVKRIAAELWGDCDGKRVRRHRYGRGTVLWNDDPAQAVAGHVADIQFLQISPGARFEAIHRRTAEADIYLVANLTPCYLSSFNQNGDSCRCRFRIDGRQPELWDPADGSVRKAPSWQMGRRHTDVGVQLKHDHAIFVVFRKPPSGPEPGIKKAQLVTEAVYGLPGAERTIDVRDQLNERIARGQTCFTVGRSLGIDPAPNQVKQLSVTYMMPDGRVKRIAAKDGETIVLAGSQKQVLLALDENWQIVFPIGLGAPETIMLPRLMNLSEHSESGVKYFSGTATYRKTFLLAEQRFADLPSSVCLDLGTVCDVVTVRLNGQELGILWRWPYHVDVTKRLRTGVNRLELDVTNGWGNRLIGDQQEPDDCQWYPDQRWGGQNIGGPLRAFPDWFADYVRTGNRPSKGRRTFVFWNKYKKNSLLHPSGLIGPVRLLHD